MTDLSDPLDGFWLRYAGVIGAALLASAWSASVVVAVVEMRAHLEVYPLGRALWGAARLIGILWMFTFFAALVLAPFYMLVASPIWLLLRRHVLRADRIARTSLVQAALAAALLCSAVLIFMLKLQTLVPLRLHRGVSEDDIPFLIAAALSLILTPLIALRLYKHD